MENKDLRQNKKNNGCPRCKSSHGEKEIEKFLIKNNLLYKSQFRIKECKNKKPLPFDFAIFKNEKLIGLIEYNGSQHYDIKFSKEQFLQTQLTDKIKQNFCKENNISLLTIPYTEYNSIETILKNWINNL